LPEPGEYTDEALLLFPIIVSLNVPFKSEERIYVNGKMFKADYLIMQKLDLEADGFVHGTLIHSRKDDHRDELLKQIGVNVLRLTNEEIIETPEKCREKISVEIEKLPKVPYCIYSNQPHHHVPMMRRIYCMSKRRYLP
jgi:hypothetical protein